MVGTWLRKDLGSPATKDITEEVHITWVTPLQLGSAANVLITFTEVNRAREMQNCKS